jgi:hypothetical protein
LDGSGELEVRGTLSALFVALTRAKKYDAARALWDWAEEWLDVEDELEDLIEEEIEDDA